MSFTPLKYIYNQEFYSSFLSKLKIVVPGLDIKAFENQIFDKLWDSRELKARMKHTTYILNQYLDTNFGVAKEQIEATIKLLNAKDYKYGELAFLFFPDYIETYGINHFDTSMKVIKNITSFTSCEFAVRPFIIQNQGKALNLMENWSRDNNFHIRRLASEGCRPKLPWAMALKNLQIDPKPILPILENLKNDSEDYVYRSVANNLNDISKDHPSLVLNIANKWKGNSKNTDWLVKHSLRTLLKAGNQDAMKIFGYGSTDNNKISALIIENNIIKIGEYLNFSFELENHNKAINRLEYTVYFLKQNGSLGKKVFKISEKEYSKNSKNLIKKRHSFKLISTRKYHLGTHQISIIINGIEKAKASFELTKYSLLFSIILCF